MTNYIDMDWAWLAVDAVGHVAVFTTAGVAPIPVAVLERAEWVGPCEEMIERMPVSTEYELLVRYPRPDDFVDFASRGFFAYDWQDVHRTHGKTNAYELIASPATPIHVDSLPSSIARAAQLIVFDSLWFDAARLLPVEQLITCKAG